MADDANEQEKAEIRLLADQSERVLTRKQVEYDLMGRGLTKADICDEIVAWIDAGERVKGTILHTIPNLEGQRAFEMKPRVNGDLYYIKVMIRRDEDSDDSLLILSFHPNY